MVLSDLNFKLVMSAIDVKKKMKEINIIINVRVVGTRLHPNRLNHVILSWRNLIIPSSTRMLLRRKKYTDCRGVIKTKNKKIKVNSMEKKSSNEWKYYFWCFHLSRQQILFLRAFQNQFQLFQFFVRYLFSASQPKNLFFIFSSFAVNFTKKKIKWFP